MNGHTLAGLVRYSSQIGITIHANSDPAPSRRLERLSTRNASPDQSLLPTDKKIVSSGFGRNASSLVV